MYVSHRIYVSHMDTKADIQTIKIRQKLLTIKIYNLKKQCSNRLCF